MCILQPRINSLYLFLLFIGKCSNAQNKECSRIKNCQLVIKITDNVEECHCQSDENKNCNDQQWLQDVPVCGSDHLTYRNSCELQNAACGKSQNITLRSKVPCGTYIFQNPNHLYAL
jgi:hypothetical protein